MKSSIINLCFLFLLISSSQLLACDEDFWVNIITTNIPQNLALESEEFIQFDIHGRVVTTNIVQGQYTITYHMVNSNGVTVHSEELNQITVPNSAFPWHVNNSNKFTAPTNSNIPDGTYTVDVEIDYALAVFVPLEIQTMVDANEVECTAITQNVIETHIVENLFSFEFKSCFDPGEILVETFGPNPGPIPSYEMKLTAMPIGGSGDFSFQWSNGSSNSFIFHPCGCDFYSVTITDNVTGCVRTAYTEEVCRPRIDCRQGTGYRIGASNELKDLQIFPNPASSMLHVQTPISIENPSFRIISVTGELVLHGSFQTGFESQRIPLDEFTPGIYLLQVYSGDELYGLQKFVKN